MTYEECKAELFAAQDLKYREFHKTLLKNETINVIGVRVPVMRAIAKAHKKEWKDILTFPDEYYEVTFLKCCVVALLPFDLFMENVDRVVVLLDNWATCDSFRAPCVAKRKKEFLPKIETYLSDGREFVVRYALVTLLDYYVEEEYLPLIFASVRRCSSEKYYIKTACAWLIAEVLAFYYEEGVAFLKEECMPVDMHNLAIQKARESYRITKEQKEQLKALKR